MPRDPLDISMNGVEKVQRRLGEADDQKEPIRLRVGAGPAGATGTEGPPGADGIDGTDGAVWYTGAGAPGAGTGVSGDFYLNVTNSDVYKKTGVTWNFVTNIEGEKGATGSTGASGKEGPAGSLENTDWKNSVRAATTANIATATALNPADVIDGVTLAENDRVLVKNQTTKSQNGIWIVKATPERALDADAVAELSGGSTIYVEEGTVNKQRTFQVVTPGNITPGTTAHEYKQLGFKDFGIVEALPTSEAVKNDRCTYVADKTNGVFWELRYDGEGEYPWKKVGGPPLVSKTTAENSTSSTSYVTLENSPSLAMPGVKMLANVRHGSRLIVTSGPSFAHRCLFTSGGTEISTADDSLNSGAPSGGSVFPNVELAASTTYTFRYKTSAGTSFWANRYLEIDPIAVG